MSNKKNSDSAYSFLKKVLIFVLIALAVTLLVMFVGRAIDTLLIIFAGVLLGTIFRSARDFIHQTFHLRLSISLVVVVLTFLSVVVGISYLLAPHIADQAEMFYEQLPETWEMTKQEISRFGWGRELARENPNIRDFFEAESDQADDNYDMTKSILGYLSTTVAIIAGLILVFVIAIYIAAEPKLYTEGLVRLFPKNRRKQVVEIMNEIAITIQWWMVGQVCSMIILGTLATLGLWLLGVPYALLLGALTAFMTFIPNLGPIIAAVPILLISLTVSVETAIYVGIFYVILQGIEGYFITPMIHRRAISVPPVLIITIQFLLYYLIGFLGVLLAMPLIGCAMVIVKRLYIQDILGDSLEGHTPHNLEGDNIF